MAGQVTEVATRLGESRRTVFRWVARYRAAPQTSSLLPRARGTPAGAQCIDAKLEALVAEAINKVYLTRVRARKEEVVRRVRLRCAAEGLAPPSRKAVLARLRQLEAAGRARKRDFPMIEAAGSCRRHDRRLRSGAPNAGNRAQVGTVVALLNAPACTNKSRTRRP